MIPDFHTPDRTGQLWDEERVALYNHVINTKPQKAFEIGKELAEIIKNSTLNLN